MSAPYAPPAPPVQDMPPKGGFGTVHYKRHLPVRGPGGAVMFAGMTAVVTYGWYWAIQGMRERRELLREKTWARIHLIPLLQAEADRAEVRLVEQQEAQEREIMKDVPGWEVGKNVYNTDRYVAPSIMVAPNKWVSKF
ncbi:hypothetical protein RI367_001078 [Sorochytrium milnesiophthora]